MARVTPGPVPTPTPAPTPAPTPTPGISTLSTVGGIVTDGSGNRYGTSGTTVVKVLPDGSSQTIATSALLLDSALAGIDSRGNLYALKHIGCRVLKIATDGTVSTFAGDGTPGFAEGQGTAARFNRPAGMAVDAADNLYISDYWNNRIRRITPGGLVSTFSGSGIRGSQDGPAATARYTEPIGICMDASGNFWQADHDGHRIRRIAPDGTASTLRNPSGNPVNYTYPFDLPPFIVQHKTGMHGYATCR
ncbi:MAG: hypothetical protein VKO64_03470 [Candidatus Sericytochromatia bacterium]|nr:hypothetical protein [Candidatus Sericytochromatia bacterium]